jgi:pyruvate-ferredoxin/flavodoxin oxidoreductase
MREKRGIKVGVVQVVWFRPFPGGRLARVLKGRKGVAVLERTDQPLAVDLPLIREVRAALSKAQENAQVLAAGGDDKSVPHQGYPAIHTMEEMPVLYSGCYGLASRDLQPGQLIGSDENMMPDGAKTPFYYLGIEFVQDVPPSAQRKKYQEELLAAYPKIGQLTVQGSENPNLMPEGAITVRFHSIGGWGAVTTGKNLSGTLFDLLGLNLKCNPKYGGEKKGTPTTYYGAFSKDRIRTNSELKFVDVVLSPDPNVFSHTNALSGLKEGGALVIQTNGETAEQAWAQFPEYARETIAKKKIKLFYIDAFGIARDEASNPDLELRMQGTVFQGAFFKVTTIMEQYGLDDKKLFDSIESVIDAKFGSKGRAVVEDNLRVVRRGFEEVHELDWQNLTSAPADSGEKRTPLLVQTASPSSQQPLTQPDRFYEQVGRWYGEGLGEDGLADPFVALSITPAVTGNFRDMTSIRFEYPVWVAEKCTGCAKCWTQCPDSAIPGLVVKPIDLINTASKALGNGSSALSKHADAVVASLHDKLNAAGSGPNGPTVALLTKEAVLEVAKSAGDTALEAEADRVQAVLTDFRVAKTKPFFDAPEKKGPGGALLAVTVNPETCKGCMECVEVCEDDALIPTKQDAAAVESLRKGWDFWRDLPDSDPAYINIKDLDGAVGVLSSLLLSKKNYISNVGGDGACMGCGEKTPIHLFCSVATALMQPRVKRHTEECNALLTRIDAKITTLGGDDARRARLDAAREKIKDLVWRYLEGPTGKGRSDMGMVNNTGCTTVWGSTYPFNPYPFPWANHLFQDGPSVAMGVFEAHAAQMGEGFKAIRVAELECADAYDSAEHDRFFELFDWRDFTDDETHLMPPVTCLGGDGAMLDIGFQNLSRALMSGRPLKVLVVDTQVYSNTGGQNCTSSFIGQVSDMAGYGEHHQGKVEPRKEIGLMGIAHRGVFTAQTSAAHFNHMIKAFVLGFNTRRPALFSAYTTCQPEHGVGDDMSAHQAKLALEGRAFPFFMYDPDGGDKLKDRISLAGNPAAGSDWPTYNLEFPPVEEGGKPEKRKVPMTFADFAASEGRFRKHFGQAKDQNDPNLVLYADFLNLSDEEAAEKTPFIWVEDPKGGAPTKLVCSPAMVISGKERLEFWHLLQDMAGQRK